MINPALYSSKTDQHATPRDLAARLVAEFGIDLDVCADATNAVVPYYYSKEQDGLKLPWDGMFYCNPPYGRSVGLWVSKAAHEPITNRDCRGGVCLLPARTDTKWFHDYVLPFASETRFLRGRLKFGDAKNSAPFPSMVVIFRP